MTCFDDERTVLGCFRDAERAELLWFSDAAIDAFARWAGVSCQYFYLATADAEKRQRIAAWYVIYRALGREVASRHLPLGLATNP